MSAGLVQRINAFLQEADMPASVFGRSVAHDPRLVADLQKGREAGQSLVSRVDAFMQDWRTAYAAGEAHRTGDRRRRHKPIIMQGNMPSAIDAFLARVDDFLTESKMRKTTFGRDAIGDGNAVNNWRKGTMPTFRTMRRVDDFMDEWRRARARLERAAARAAAKPAPEPVALFAPTNSAPLASIAMRETGSDARKAIELLRIAIESLQPIARGAMA
jgi:hypothetical protein